MAMALDLTDYDRKARDAVMAFWGNREKARQKQIEAGMVDQGERAGVTSGKNMDGFIALVIDLVKANGLAHASIHRQKALLTLPGYFRPTKLWNLLVLNEGRLIAAIELKSQVGPSFGNNYIARSVDGISGGRFWQEVSAVHRLDDAGRRCAWLAFASSRRIPAFPRVPGISGSLVPEAL